jgi:hypothetical protein
VPELGRRIARTAAAAGSIASLEIHARSLSLAWQSLLAAIEHLRAGESRSALDNATPFLWGFGHVVLAWLWLDQAVTAASLAQSGAADQRLVDGKLQACRFFFECELPKADPLLAFVASRSDVASSASTGIF